MCWNQFSGVWRYFPVRSTICILHRQCRFVSLPLASFSDSSVYFRYHFTLKEILSFIQMGVLFRGTASVQPIDRYYGSRNSQIYRSSEILGLGDVLNALQALDATVYPNVLG